jgi:hypothetical protein
MSQFFDQYNAILEKSLQKVRLRVDPNVKYAEDFAQYDGYVGYILAETDESIDFFYENNTVTLPKNVVFIEEKWERTKAAGQWLGDKAKAVGQGAGNFIRGAAGQNTGTSVAGALGSIAGSAAKGAANFGSMLYTGQKLFDGNKQQTGNSTASTQAVDKTKSIAVKNKNGNASITINGMDYGIINIKDANNKSLVMLNNNVLILAHYNAFSFLLNKNWSTLNENWDDNYERIFGKKNKLNAGQAAGNPAASVSAAQLPATAPAPAAPNAPAPAAPNAPAPAAPNNTTATPTASAADAFLQMPSVTVSALNAKKLLGVPLVVSLSPITQPNATNKPSTPIDYSVKFTAAPNNAEVLVTFL